jgi:hypothetical protein
MTKHFSQEGEYSKINDTKLIKDLTIINELKQENQVLKKALAYQENENKILKNNIESLEKQLRVLIKIINEYEKNNR